MHHAVRLDTREIPSSQNRETQWPCSEFIEGWCNYREENCPKKWLSGQNVSSGSKDLNSAPQKPHKEPGKVLHTPAMSALGRQKREDPWVSLV